MAAADGVAVSVLRSYEEKRPPRFFDGDPVDTVLLVLVTVTAAELVPSSTLCIVSNCLTVSADEHNTSYTHKSATV